MRYFVSGRDSYRGIYSTLLDLEDEDFISLDNIENIMFAGTKIPEDFIFTSISKVGD